MKRLTTDNPKNNFEVVMNMVYGKDGRLRQITEEEYLRDFGDDE